jgi:hypothetical protein
VLPVSHATRDAVHGDAHCPACHESFLHTAVASAFYAV